MVGSRHGRNNDEGHPHLHSTLRTTDFFCANARRERRKDTSLTGKLAELNCNRKSQITTLSLHSIKSRLSSARYNKRTARHSPGCSVTLCSIHTCGLSIHNPQSSRAPTRTRTWNPLIKSPAMMTQDAQNRALLGSWVAINCHKLPPISIKSLHFHYTRWGRRPPSSDEYLKL